MALSERGPVPPHGFVGLWHNNETRNLCVFNSALPRLSAPPSFPSESSPLSPALTRSHPVGTGSASVLRTMLPKSRRLRWLSAGSNQEYRSCFTNRPKVFSSRTSLERNRWQLSRVLLMVWLPFWIHCSAVPRLL